jgi:hypothetical protein
MWQMQGVVESYPCEYRFTDGTTSDTVQPSVIPLLKQKRLYLPSGLVFPRGLTSLSLLFASLPQASILLFALLFKIQGVYHGKPLPVVFGITIDPRLLEEVKDRG